MNRSFLPVVASCAALWLAAPGAPQAKAGEGPPRAVSEGATARFRLPSDVIARVGDQTITFGEINTALNSSAVVGVSVPALGTPERDTVRVMLLDRFVSANLLYLDARKQGLDQDPAYRREVERFDNAMLAGLYRQHSLLGEIPVSEEEIQAYHEKNFVAGTELTPDLRASIESKLRREKVKQKLADARTHIRDGVEVVVHEENLAPAGDAERARQHRRWPRSTASRSPGAPSRTASSRAGKGAVIADPLADEEVARRHALETEIDLRIMAKKATGRRTGSGPPLQGPLPTSSTRPGSSTCTASVWWRRWSRRTRS